VGVRVEREAPEPGREKGQDMKKNVVFWDMDTQYDLMRPEGRLYVPGAESIIGNVGEARRFALDNGYSIVAVIDWHKQGNKEISNTPDFEHNFPAHCMADTPGSERVGYLGELPIDVVPNAKMSGDELRGILQKKQFHIVVRKEELDMFSNPNTATILKILQPKEVVVFGVALDLCVCQAVESLIGMGGIKPYILRDAVKTLGLKGDEEILEGFRKRGVEIIKLEDLKRKFA
jgi:nicotinamidase/pyrazinamidase